MPTRAGTSLYNLYKAYRARRAAVRLLTPFFNRSLWQAGSISPASWAKAYVVGYVTTLITAASQDAMSGLDGNTLGLVQLEAWSELTGVPSDLIGERILSFSLTDDADSTRRSRTRSGCTKISRQLGPSTNSSA
jgi:hypothetical protein